MAVLAARAPYPAPLAASSGIASYRTQSRDNHGFFASPTESEFSERYDAQDSVRYERRPVVAGEC